MSCLPLIKSSLNFPSHRHEFIGISGQNPAPFLAKLPTVKVLDVKDKKGHVLFTFSTITSKSDHICQISDGVR